jgi:hypothetical protein
MFGKSSLRKGYVLIITFLLITMILTNAGAKNFDVGDKFIATDIVIGSTSYIGTYNSYDFRMEEDEEIDFSVEVVGAGKVQVLMALEHGPNLNSNIAIAYSTDEEVDSYSKTMPHFSFFNTNEFSLVVVNHGIENITYNIKIEISSTAVENMLFCVGGILAIIVPAILIVFFLLRKIRKQERHRAQKEAAPLPPPQSRCLYCNSPTDYIPQHGQFYCHSCRTYSKN